MQDLKNILACILNTPEFWHDRLHHYPAADGIEGSGIALFVEWSQRHATKTPEYLLTEEIPDDSEVTCFLQPDQGAFSLLSLSVFLESSGMRVNQSLDLIYCRRPETLSE